MNLHHAVLSLRPDLIYQSIWLGARKIWVVKDPVTRQFNYFEPSEYAMLRLADGTRDLSQIIQQCRQLVAPLTITDDTVQRFFAAAYAAHIVLADGAGCPPESTPGRAGRWLRNPLAIRFPGVNPDRFLGYLAGYANRWFQPLTCLGMVLVMVAGAVIAMTYLPALLDDIHDASGRLVGGQGIWIILSVVSLTKIAHEMAHAITCKVFGGHVPELGVMLLVGVPCLYCDVSDAWLFPERWKRVLVSAAGILAELTIAGVAAFLWLLASDGVVSDVCAIVIAVCSVTTILFNGNPLLRYDGYFILSDLVGIPNLATESAAEVRRWARNALWGTRQTGDQPNWIGIYGLLSGCYRLVLYTTIASMLFAFAKRHGLDRTVGCLILFVFTGLAYRYSAVLLRRPKQVPATHRPAWVATGFVVAILAIGLVPLPQSVTAPMSVSPADARPIFVARPGRIVTGIQHGAPVQAGDLLARIENESLQLELAAARAERERLSVQLASLRQSRTTSPVSAASIAATEQAFASSQQRLALLERDADSLELRSPAAGRVYAPRRAAPTTARDGAAEYWSETPLEPSNRGAWLETGTILCVIGHREDRDAVVLIRQQDAELVRPQQHVCIRLADHPRTAITGRVLGISSSPVEMIDAELSIAANLDPALPVAEPYYLVRVELSALSVPIRTTGLAKIRVGDATILERLGRFLADTFG